MKKRTLALLLVALLLFNVTACSGGSSSKKEDTSDSEKPTVRIALCVAAMMDSIPHVLRAKFPDVNFEFTLANNDTRYYKYLKEHDDLPDIITVRRFSLLDAVDLKDDLVDLSKTDLAASYYQNYLDNYMYDDGTINWLPALAEVWCIVANKTLFEQHNIELPTDYDSFIAACEAFEKEGIQGFTSDWSYDYTALETLEGFNMPKLQSIDGKKWRTQYESGVDSLDNSFWIDAFTHMEDVLKKTNNVASNEKEATALAAQTYDSTDQKFKTGEIAMIRGGGSDLTLYNEEEGNTNEYVMLPYFGETTQDNWVMTYPYYQAAINKNSDVDADLLMEIYTYMYSQDTQDSLGKQANFYSYSSNVTTEMNKYMDNLNTYLDDNKIFIRLANNSFFAAAFASVQGMVKGEYDAKEAYEVFSKTLSQKEEEKTMDLTFDTGYEYSFQKDHGSQSSSAILNSCREVWKTDFAVTYAPAISNSVYKGQSSSSLIAYLIAGNYGINYRLELTGAQVKELIGTMINFELTSDSTGIGMLPKADNMLPVTSGLEMEVNKLEDGGYELAKLTVDGKELSDTETYSIVYSVPGAWATYIASQAGITLTDEQKDAVPAMADTLTTYLVDEGKQLASPTDYITLH